MTTAFVQLMPVGFRTISLPVTEIWETLVRNTVSDKLNDMLNSDIIVDHHDHHESDTSGIDVPVAEDSESEPRMII